MDLIDRQEVISALEKVAGFFPYKEPGNRDSYNEYNEAWNDAIGRAEMEIGKLPSAFGVGHWVWQERGYFWTCSECGQNPTRGMGYVQSRTELFGYCPDCGAYMRGGEE